VGHMKDSLWSMDLFRCESATLRTHWVLVVMDQYTRRIIGFGVHAGSVDGVALCRMFNRAIRGQRWMSKYLSSDNDRLYRFHQWQANLRVLELTEIKSILYVPLSHPFVERLIGTLRREYLDRLLFWTTADLENKLLDFRTYFNNHRTHTSREGRTPDTPASGISLSQRDLPVISARVSIRQKQDDADAVRAMLSVIAIAKGARTHARFRFDCAAPVRGGQNSGGELNSKKLAGNSHRPKAQAVNPEVSANYKIACLRRWPLCN
jgi:hypothetical protein